ncbi:MAG: translocation/assembly module TamB domain-containing protein [Candidatus Acidiferrales bacterium]
MKIRWFHWVRLALGIAFASIVAVTIAFETGLVEHWVRRMFIQQFEQSTGARVELGAFHLHAWRLRVEMDDLTLHGLEPASSPPLFHAAHVDLQIHILSYWGKQFVLDELLIDRPQVALRFDKNGQSNLPSPRVQRTNQPWRETLFHLRVGQIALRDGSASLNDRRYPLELRGKDLEFLLHYAAPSSGDESYVGNFSWKQVELAERRDVPFRFDISAKFTLHRNAFELDEFVWKLPHSELNLRAELPSFARADWNLRYRGRLSLADIRTIFRQPTTPDGIAEFSGQARYASGEWTGSGHYSGHEISMPYQWFHSHGIETWGDYEIVRERLIVPKFGIRALAGTINGRLEMDFKNLAFRTQTQLRGVSLAAAFHAVNNRDFPVDTFHWDARMEVDSVNTWQANFKHFRSKGESRWSPPDTLATGSLPVTARVEYDYSEDTQVVTLAKSEITTPNTSLKFDGYLGAKDSALELSLHTDELLGWDDFINDLRGTDVEPTRVIGVADWNGRILGPLGGPTFTGHLHATRARYDNLYWDEIEGDLDYSPDAFRLAKTVVRRGQTSADIDVWLKLDGAWSFLPQSAWTLDVQLKHAPTADVQEIFGTDYPVNGFLSGTFQGSGTRVAPVMDGNFVLEEVEAKGFRFDRLSGQLHLAHDEYRLSHAALRKDTGKVAGDFLYRPVEQETEFNITGTGIPLDKISALQFQLLSVSGSLQFDLRGSGPIRTPHAEGNLRLVNLQIGSDLQGDFRGQLSSDGQNAHIVLASEMTRGTLNGQINVGLTGDNPVSGTVSVEGFDLDAFIVAGLHLKQLTGHSSVDGEFAISGAVHQPETIEVKADIQQISFNYDFVQLQNDGPVHLSYRRNEVRVEQAHLHGPSTDFTLVGAARFDRDRALHFTLDGGVNLKFINRVVPDLHAQGAANVNILIEGTMARPRVTGRANVRDASANYSDFPVGLSHVSGDFVFDRSRLLFERVTAQAGGGQLVLNGGVTYADGPVRYEVNVATTTVRIRYPAGMSWLAGGTLQLAGTSEAAILSGRVEVKRILLAEGVDVASFFATASDTTAAPTSTSPFLRNLTFDIAGNTSPGARIEWTGAQLDIDGDVRLRGTWDRPILLGHIHLLGGQMAFRGNNFTLTRGDINFANPFQLDPELNVEATSVISQYQVTINFSGKASKLALSYRSDPPLPDTDIIALLALGSTGEESALRSQATSSQNYGATALLSEAISSGLGGRIEHLFGISHFRVDPFLSGTATESNAAARVTIQQQVTRSLTVTYSTNAATSNQYQLIQVEYAVRRDLSVIFLRDINGTYGFDVKFVKHFK